MIGQWLEPITEWLGLGIIPLLLVAVLIVLIVKGARQ